jgi:glycerate kinase
MKVLVCPDKFKGCLEAAEVAEAVAAGLAAGAPGVEAELLPLADGGEGTAEILRSATGGTRRDCAVFDPLGRLVSSYYVVLGDGETAVVEMAAASGYALLAAEERDPLRASTYGTGELIRSALDSGLRRVIVAIGGSATNDGGMGMAAALGARFLDDRGASLEPCGASLGKVVSIDLSGLDERVRSSEFIVACDVTNPLLGQDGATRVFGPQKGADEVTVGFLEEGMASYARAVEGMSGRELASVPGAGAAGGLGFGLIAFLSARVEPGIEVVMRAVGFAERARGCDLIVTGEGSYDAQTSFGKTVSGVARAARELGVPLVILAGAVSRDVVEQADSSDAGEGSPVSCFCVTPRPMPLEEAMASARANLTYAAAQLARFLRLGSGPKISFQDESGGE